MAWQGKQLKVKKCERCGHPYQPNGPAQRFCDACWRIKTCRECGAEFTIPKQERAKDRNRRWYCDNCIRDKRGAPSHLRAVELAGSDTRRVTKTGGYVEVNKGWQPVRPDTPAPLGHTRERRVHPEGYVYVGRVREHRWVMEQVLQRPLRDDEIVHHKNGNRQDNRPENLEVWLKADNHKGSRPEDLLAHALEVLLKTDPGQAHKLLAEAGFVPATLVIQGDLASQGRRLSSHGTGPDQPHHARGG
jgi:hypothetical protein